MSGIKTCSTSFNDNSYPVEVHMAVLRIKVKEPPLFTASSIGTDFYRDFTGAADGESNFPNIPRAIEMLGNQQ